MAVVILRKNEEASEDGNGLVEICQTQYVECPAHATYTIDSVA